MQNNGAMGMKRKKGLRRSRINPVSKKRAVQLAKYRKLREAMLADWRGCEFYPVTCTKQATDLHHVRGRRGDLLLDKNNIVLLCREHHRTVHDNANWARWVGLLK